MATKKPRRIGSAGKPGNKVVYCDKQKFSYICFPILQKGKSMKGNPYASPAVEAAAETIPSTPLCVSGVTGSIVVIEYEEGDKE